MRKRSSGQPTLADIAQCSRAVLGVPRLNAKQSRRLAELGLRAGTRVYVVLDTVGGGRVIAVAAVNALDHGRVALDRATCRRIPVDVEPRR